MKRILCLIAAITLEITLLQDACAQNTRFSFTYDLNGNRTARSIIVLKSNENEIGNDAVADYYDSSENCEDAGIDTFDGINMSIYPNPTCGSIILSTDISQHNQPINASLLSLSGNLLENKTITVSETEFNLNGYSPGVYFLVINCQNENHVWKVIKTQ